MFRMIHPNWKIMPELDSLLFVPVNFIGNRTPSYANLPLVVEHIKQKVEVPPRSSPLVAGKHANIFIFRSQPLCLRAAPSATMHSKAQPPTINIPHNQIACKPSHPSSSAMAS